MEIMDGVTQEAWENNFFLENERILKKSKFLEVDN